MGSRGMNRQSVFRRIDAMKAQRGDQQPRPSGVTADKNGLYPVVYDDDMLVPLKARAVLIADRISSAQKVCELEEILITEKEKLPLKGAVDYHPNERFQ